MAGTHRKPASRTVRSLIILAGAVAAGLLAASLSAALTAPAAGATVRHHRIVLRYAPHTILCHRRQAGRYATVIGDGRPFTVRCLPDGPVVYAWDAIPGKR